MLRPMRPAAATPSRRSGPHAPPPLPRPAAIAPAPFISQSHEETRFPFPNLSFSQFAVGRGDLEGRQEAELDVDQSGVRSMRRRVVPPTSFHGRVPEDLLNVEQVDLEEDCNGGTNSGYYTDLLVNGADQSQDLTPTDPTPPSDPTIQHDRATAKSSQGRSKNFREEEDILLVSGWLNVGMDPIQGADQTHGTLWTRIYDYFHANKTFNSTRTESSLMNRWSGIQHDVNLFCGCLSRIEAKNHSGWTVDDKIANACTMFTAEDQKNRKFVYLHCWKILKDKPKWMERRKEIGGAKKSSNKKQKTVANSSPGSVAGAVVLAAPLAVGADAEPSARPEGKKKEKQKLRQRSTIEAVDYLMAKKKEADLEKDLKKEERCNKAFALQEERIKLEREKFELQRDLEEERILGLDLSTMNYNRQQYYEVRQNEILARRCNI
ncbi:unnamed protein product [Urochloa decumbens]|uniref:No apical meristem-associated C-terminal domain-containing protein n=1 Tax=Urochloa decumbens TaxID=240449 RepID=A0ABC8WUI2_9POAL